MISMYEADSKYGKYYYICINSFLFPVKLFKSFLATSLPAKPKKRKDICWGRCLIDDLRNKNSLCISLAKLELFPKYQILKKKKLPYRGGFIQIKRL